jgi:hypothetical protein
MLWLQLILTAIMVALILRFNAWIVKQRRERPEFYRQRPAMFMLLQFFFSLGDLF